MTNIPPQKPTIPKLVALELWKAYRFKRYAQVSRCNKMLRSKDQGNFFKPVEDDDRKKTHQSALAGEFFAIVGMQFWPTKRMQLGTRLQYLQNFFKNLLNFLWSILHSTRIIGHLNLESSEMEF